MKVVINPELRVQLGRGDAAAFTPRLRRALRAVGDVSSRTHFFGLTFNCILELFPLQPERGEIIISAHRRRHFLINLQHARVHLPKSFVDVENSSLRLKNFLRRFKHRLIHVLLLHRPFRDIRLEIKLPRRRDVKHHDRSLLSRRHIVRARPAHPIPSAPRQRRVRVQKRYRRLPRRFVPHRLPPIRYPLQFIPTARVRALDHRSSLGRARRYEVPHQTQVLPRLQRAPSLVLRRLRRPRRVRVLHRRSASRSRARFRRSRHR